ncbi:uncharacterized protein LOC135144890 [Zophobas morio]|uniref:uncharacterized protein LOC135144890 n=1 Tax=Zophobas morio TaxID=2755281 RepID=UPI0030837A65
MSITWGLIMPIAIFLPFIIKKKEIRPLIIKIHIVLSNLAALVATIGLALVISNGRRKIFTDLHSIVGVSIYTLLIAQILNGIFKPRASSSQIVNSETPSKLRQKWEAIHNFFGWICTLLSLYPFYSG